MVRGIDVFRKHFKGFENQYVLIGGAACDILFAKNNSQFRATRDVETFIKGLEASPFDENLLKALGLSNEEMVDRLVELYGVK